MIMVGRIAEFKKGMCNHTFAIVRSFRCGSTWIQQVPQLSPSSELFNDYLKVWKPNGIWNKNTFAEKYVPRFLEQLTTDQTAIKWLNWIVKQDREGNTIGLACFCTDETLCHRSIIAGLLQGVGANVKTTTGADYSHYYEQFKEFNQKRHRTS